MIQGLRSTFFLSPSAISQIGKRTVEETKAHLVFLGAGGEDAALSRAALADGNAVDFVFNVKGADSRSVVAKANDVKKLIRSMDEHGQKAIAKFYLVVFQSMATYHKKMSHPCSCCWATSLRKNMIGDIEEAFDCLKGMISDRNVLRDD
jgi:hypothetical protein